MEKFPLYILDSGDPDEYREIAELAKDSGSILWGGTTNPTLIAKKLAGQKFSEKEAFNLQKKIVLELLTIVPGSISAEVYADKDTKAKQMINQGKEIASWSNKIHIKLPTTIEGFKARSALRKEKIPTNNTLVFSLEQIFAICLHERIMSSEARSRSAGQKTENLWPTFISPFVGRLDDINIDGMSLVENGMMLKEKYNFNCWMLEASVRSIGHMQRGAICKSELITAPPKVYKEWFLLTQEQKDALDTKTYAKGLKQIPQWWPSDELLNIRTEDEFFKAIENKKLNIDHPLTTAGVIRFAADWQSILIT